MSGYSPRRGPNVSQYIANLNTIPSAHDLDSRQQEDYSLEDDLALFTNTEFFDFDAGGNIEQSLVNFEPTQEGQARVEGVTANYNNSDVTGLDLNNGMCAVYICPNSLFMGIPFVYVYPLVLEHWSNYDFIIAAFRCRGCTKLATSIPDGDKRKKSPKLTIV